MMWAFIGPVIALMFMRRSHALVWFIIYLSCIAATIYLDPLLIERRLEVTPAMRTFFFAMNMSGASIVVFIFSRYFVSNTIKEREKANSLLLNILPVSVAQELKDSGTAKSRSYKQVTIMFTDFKGFTKIAERMPAEEVVSELDHCFRKFDRIALMHGLEKIKTIGDAYMCVGGLPNENETHAKDTAMAALKMLKFMDEWQSQKQVEGKPAWEIRIGIHTGHVVAGIVGSSKFSYDIWGDDVNTAARMESSGEPGKINISSATYQQIKDQFNCRHRGKIIAKNKGELDMYFIDIKQ